MNRGRYTHSLTVSEQGIDLRPLLPPHGVTSLKLRGVSLAGSRLEAKISAAAAVSVGNTTRYYSTTTLTAGGSESASGAASTTSTVIELTLASGPPLVVKVKGKPDAPLTEGGEAVRVELCESCGCGCPGGGCGCLSIAPAK